jgi:U3 small nucleolar RNA-associated protein 12
LHVIAGSTDQEVRVYRVQLPSRGDSAAAAARNTGNLSNPNEAANDAGAAPAGGDVQRAPVLCAMGSVKRLAAGHDRVAALRYDDTGSLLAVQSAGKSLEIFR